jgi:hypothetical protein
LIVLGGIIVQVLFKVEGLEEDGFHVVKVSKGAEFGEFKHCSSLLQDEFSLTEDFHRLYNGKKRNWVIFLNIIQQKKLEKLALFKIS